MTGSVVEAQTLPASELVEEDVPATPGAPRALEPRQRPVGPHHQQGFPLTKRLGARVARRYPFSPHCSFVTTPSTSAPILLSMVASRRARLSDGKRGAGNRHGVRST